MTRAAQDVDDLLLRSLPLPVAQLHRRALNAKTPLERHQAAYYLWEASLKLLGSVAVVEYGALEPKDPQLTDRLRSLTRPSLGHWWEIVRRLVSALAASGDAGFTAVRDFLFGRTRDDLPRAAGLDAVLLETLEQASGARSSVRPAELFERLVKYRNRELGHGAAGQRPAAFYERMGSALLSGMAEILRHFDLLAGRRLLYVDDVRRRESGTWLVELYELCGENARRIESLETGETDAARLPCPRRVYLAGDERREQLRSLHPLVLFDVETSEPFFLSARRGARRSEYLSYLTGRVLAREELARDQVEFLGKVLGTTVDGRLAEEWAERSRAEDEPPAAEREDVPAERSIGGFQLLSRIGRGGMGVVYRAWQPSLSRSVALKCLLRSGDPKAESRFLREIRALGRVEHPHLVKIFSSGAEGDQWFYAMELLEGADLGSVCALLAGESASEISEVAWSRAVSTACEEAQKKEEPLSDPKAPRTLPSPSRSWRSHSLSRAAPPRLGAGHIVQVVELIRQVAGAAHALHEAGVIHRDIKPGNIHVTPDGAQAVLMDLGLAQLMDDAEGRLTRTRQFVGTLRYASPEQVLAIGSLDRRSDVYSLGATLWELLTLSPLFGAGDETPTPRLMLKIQSQEPERPGRLNPLLPADLEAIVLKCLEKSPERRYATAAELDRDLERFLRGEPVMARPVGHVERAWRWCRRNPVVAGLTGGLLISLVAAAVIATIGYLQTSKALVLAKDERAAAVAAEGRARVAEGLAKDEADLARRLQYTSDMQLVGQLWESEHGTARKVHELLMEYLPRENKPDLRDFAWRHQWTLLEKSSATLRGHSGGVILVAFDRDGRVLTLDRQFVLRRWEKDGRPVGSGEKLGGPRRFSSWAWSDQAGLMALGRGRTVQLFDASSGREVQRLTMPSLVLNLSFSTDGRLLGVGCGDGPVRVFDLRSSAKVSTIDLPGKAQSYGGIALSGDGSALFAANRPESLMVTSWRATDGKAESWRASRALVSAVSGLPAGGLFASGDWSGDVVLWDATTHERKWELTNVHSGPVSRIAFSPDGATLATGGQVDGLLTLWDVTMRARRRILKGHSGCITDLAFSRDGATLASASRDSTARVWALDPVEQTMGFEVSAFSVSYSPDGRWFAVGGGEGLFRPGGGKAEISDARTRVLVHRLDADEHRVIRLAFSPDSATLATGGYDTRVKLWDVATGRLIRSLEGLSGLPYVFTRHPVGALDFSRDGRFLVAGHGEPIWNVPDFEPELKVWDARSGDKLHRIQGHTNGINSLAFSVDGKTLATASNDRTVRLWAVGTWDEVRRLTGPSAFKSIAFSPDGRVLAAGSFDGAILLFDAAAGEKLHEIQAHTFQTHGLAFSPDGGTLASGGFDRTLKLWDVRAARELRTIRGYPDWVLGVAFDREGSCIATGSADKKVRFCEAAPAEEIAARLAERSASEGREEGRTDAARERASWRSASLPAEALDDLVGLYQLGANRVVTVTRRGDHLTVHGALQTPADAPTDVFPATETEFFARDADLEVTFLKGERGNVTGLVLHRWKEMEDAEADRLPSEPRDGKEGRR